ncbi:MAG TPA: PaaX family transcriptional regulator C-terminal domain-containing protein [Solirubrobacteraceae bacterium]
MSAIVAAGPLAAGEPFQPQDLVVTLLGTYVRPYSSTVWSGGLVVLLAEFGFSHGAARVALTRLVRRGLITRVRSGRLVHYRITPRCERVLLEGDGRIFSLGDPHDDGRTWTLLWHQIPEDRRLQRSRLARRLRFLGFGSVQDSVWVSPHDHFLEVVELLEELEVDEFATLFRAPVDAAAGLGPFVSRAWNMSGLAERYDGFCSEFGAFIRRGRVQRLGDLEAFIVRTRLVHLFREFPVMDPELPEELAPLGRARARAVEIFHALYEGLAEPSQRHFEAVVGVVEAGAA